jgi:hypothetical protein
MISNFKNKDFTNLWRKFLKQLFMNLYNI